MMLKNSNMDNARLVLKLLLLTSYSRNSHPQQQSIDNQTEHNSLYGQRAASDECCPQYLPERCAVNPVSTTNSTQTTTASPSCEARDFRCQFYPYEMTYPDHCTPPPPMDCGYPEPPVCPPETIMCRPWYIYLAKNKWRCPHIKLRYRSWEWVPGMKTVGYTQTKPKCHKPSQKPVTSCMKIHRDGFQTPACRPIGADECGGYDCDYTMYELEGCKCDSMPQYYCPKDDGVKCNITYEYRPHYGCCPAVVFRVLRPGGNRTEQRMEPKDYNKNCIAGASGLGAPQLTVLLIAALTTDIFSGKTFLI